MNVTKQDLEKVEERVNGSLASVEGRIERHLDSLAESINGVAKEIAENNKTITRLIVESENNREIAGSVVDLEKRLSVVELRQNGILELATKIFVPVAAVAIMVWFGLKTS